MQHCYYVCKCNLGNVQYKTNQRLVLSNLPLWCMSENDIHLRKALRVIRTGCVFRTRCQRELRPMTFPNIEGENHYSLGYFRSTYSSSWFWWDIKDLRHVVNCFSLVISHLLLTRLGVMHCKMKMIELLVVYLFCDKIFKFVCTWKMKVPKRLQNIAKSASLVEISEFLAFLSSEFLVQCLAIESFVRH